jgi:hypothetical protein
MKHFEKVGTIMSKSSCLRNCKKGSQNSFGLMKLKLDDNESDPRSRKPTAKHFQSVSA